MLDQNEVNEGLRTFFEEFKKDGGSAFQSEGEYLCGFATVFDEAIHIVIAAALRKTIEGVAMAHMIQPKDIVSSRCALLFVTNAIRLHDSGMIDLEQVLDHLHEHHYSYVQPSLRKGLRAEQYQAIEAVRANFTGSIWTMPMHSVSIGNQSA